MNDHTEDKKIAVASLMLSLAKAQSEFKAIRKNRTVEIPTKNGGRYSFSYADLEEIISATRPALTANGLSVIQPINDGKLFTIIMHENGHQILSSIDLPSHNGDTKAYGATVSYLRRYAYQSLLCVAADDDIDEDVTDHNQQNGSADYVQGKPAVESLEYTQQRFDSNLPGWTDAILTRGKTADFIIQFAESRGGKMSDEQKQILKDIENNKGEQE